MHIPQAHLNIWLECVILHPRRVDSRADALLVGAKLLHLHKYTAVYDERYPEATKILIQCEPSFFWSRESTRVGCALVHVFHVNNIYYSQQQANLAPAVEVLQTLGYISPRPREDLGTASIPLLGPRVLVHAFSNGENCF